MQKSLKKILTSVAVALVAASGAVPVMAEGTTYTPVNGGEITIQKYLIMDNAANVPNVTFAFTIAPGSAVDSTNPETKAQVREGLAGATISSATFAAGQQTFTEAQPIAASDGIRSAGLNDNVTLATGEKYARSPIAVNFEAVAFPEPGIYRYVINETASDTSKGITNDEDATRYLDVYIIDNAGALEVQGYVLHDSDSDETINSDGSMPTDFMKAQSYVNRYETHDLTISKAVSGNGASRDEYFKFTVKIENAIAGTVYDVDLTNADANTKTNTSNADNQVSHVNPASLTVGDDGTVTQDFWLQNNQSIKIQGLADNTKYSVTEDDALLDKEAYSTTCEQTGDTDGTFAAATRKLENAAITDDTTDAFTNSKTSIVPTGAILKVMPYALVMGMAIVIFLVSRNTKEEN